MKASICSKYGGPEVYQILEVETPKPQDTEVLVKVYSAVVSPTDGNFRSGKPLIARLFSGLFKPRVKIHGEMFVGEVVEIGKDVQEFKVSDIVYGTNGMKLGAYAEYVAIDVKNTIKKAPDNINHKDVLSLLDGGITALPFLRELGMIKENQEVLINGASGAVGSMAVMIAKHFKAKVTGVCSTKNVSKVKSLGADHVIDYTQEDFTQLNHSYDIIFDAVGKLTYKNCKKSLSDKGIYMTTVPTPSVMIGSLFNKNKEKKRAGFMAAGLRKKQQKMNDLEFLEKLLISGELRPLQGKSFKLSELGKAQEYVETGHKVGNVTIDL